MQCLHLLLLLYLSERSLRILEFSTGGSPFLCLAGDVLWVTCPTAFEVSRALPLCLPHTHSRKLFPITTFFRCSAGQAFSLVSNRAATAPTYSNPFRRVSGCLPFLPGFPHPFRFQVLARPAFLVVLSAVRSAFAHCRRATDPGNSGAAFCPSASALLRVLLRSIQRPQKGPTLFPFFFLISSSSFSSSFSSYATRSVPPVQSVALPSGLPRTSALTKREEMKIPDSVRSSLSTFP